MNPSFFSPKSVFWRVNREFACSLVAPRAVLMQIAHPLVAAEWPTQRVSSHRFARLYRTAMAAAAIVRKPRFRDSSLRSVNQKHHAVHGVLKKDAGIFPPARRTTRTIPN
jgi:uncharacterized protein (DUF2236 family)